MVSVTTALFYICGFFSPYENLSMKLLAYFVLPFFVICSAKLAIAQKRNTFETEHLTYANENLEIKGYYLLTKEYAIIAVPNPNTARPSQSITIGFIHKAASSESTDYFNLILVKNGVFVDTLEAIGYPMSFKYLGNDIYAFNALGTYHQIQLDKDVGQISRVKDLLAFDPPEVQNLDSCLASIETMDFYTDRYAGYSIGYERYKPIFFYHKDDHPVFFIENTTTKKRTLINSRDIPFATKTKRLFWSDGYYYFAGQHTYHHNKVYFSVSAVNRCYIADLKTQKVSYFTFPEVKGKQACAYIYDIHSEKEYVIRKLSKKKFELFELQNGYTSIRLLSTLDFLPKQIVDNHLLKELTVTEGKKKFNAYYLIPLSDVRSESNILLETVDIQK